MGREIERKFRVVQPPGTWQVEGLATSAVEIRQGYLTPPEADPEVRLRIAREISPATADQPVPRSELGPHGVNWVRKLAIKGRARAEGGALSRVEVEVDLTEEDFHEAWDLTVGRRLRKIRVSSSFLTDDGTLFAVSVDSFRDELSGLVLAEIEFDDLRASARFDPPAFLGVEVTDDPRYRNASLAHAAAPPPDEPAS